MNLQKLMKQAQAMQANMAQAQARLATKEFTAEAAGGKIKILYGVGHNAWDEAYRGDELYTWLLSHRRVKESLT